MSNKTPLTYEEWVGQRAQSYNDELVKSFDRLHNMDYKKEFDNMLRIEYQEYLSDFNGNWLLK
jgi:hypothetical protein